MIAKFTQKGGQKFIGDIMIQVTDGQRGPLLFPLEKDPWRDTALKGNIITTPPLSVASKEVVAYAKARVTLIERGYRICCKACCSRCPAEIRCRQGSM
ncbi:MAG: hypothetical protein DME69_00515 [Verrucomicrobia bacterium]|nr:MAG: hypothetical protein DME69_00515 [Verrucomicrobiota bacterium]